MLLRMEGAMDRKASGKGTNEIMAKRNEKN